MKWPNSIIWQLVRFTNPGGTITNSDLELATLVLQEAFFSSIIVSLAWQKPTLGSGNTPKSSWTFRKASTINPVVDELLSIR